MNLLYSKVTKVGKQSLSVAGGGRYYFEAPENGAEWGLRFIVTLLYPRSGGEAPPRLGRGLVGRRQLDFFDFGLPAVATRPRCAVTAADS